MNEPVAATGDETQRESPRAAMGLLEPLVAERPADDELRRRYVESAASAGEQMRAAEVLAKAIQGVDDAGARERIGLEVGMLFLGEGELKAARAAFLDVVLVGAATPSAVAAAKRVLDLEGDPGDDRVVGAALEVLAKGSPDLAVREQSATRLLALRRARALGLARVLEAEVELAPDEARPALLARLGDLRASEIGDAQGALSAFAWCLSNDRANEVALAGVERLMAVGDRRLAAAEVLETVYRDSPSAEGRMRVLETQAELLEHASSRLEALSEAVALSLTAPGDARRALSLGHRALGLALAHAPDTVGAWLDRLQVAADRGRGFDALGAGLLELLGDGPIETAPRVAVAALAMGALQQTGHDAQALALGERALLGDPSSPELLRRLDELLRHQQTPAERLARYDAARERTTDPVRRRALLRATASIRRDSLDRAGAMEVWRLLLQEDPTDLATHLELIETTAEVDGPAAALEAIERARGSLAGRDAERMTLRKAEALLAAGGASSALDVCRELTAGDAEPSTLWRISEIGRQHGDPALAVAALERWIATCGDEAGASLALERLGDLQFERLLPDEAANAWKAAAAVCSGRIEEADRERSLHERVLRARPGDRESARRLVALHARSGDWTQLRQVFGASCESDEERVAVLLELEACATGEGALDVFVPLVRDAIARMDSASPGTGDVSGASHAMKRLLARSLASSAPRSAEAAGAYRDLVQSFADREDVRAFELFVESRSNAEERHENQRWLWQWRAESDTDKVSALLSWARAEEEFGAPAAACAVYQKLAELDTSRSVLEGPERARLDLRMAGLLVDLERAADAAVPLASALAFRPPIAAVDELVQRLLSNPAAWSACSTRLDEVLAGLDPLPALRAYESLVVASAKTTGARGGLDPAVAEALGRRMLALEETLGLESAETTVALEALLAACPGARWALDRVKVALGSQGRWDDLLGVYDRAIAAAAIPERADLLHEAAFAAKDLAAQPVRALAYLEALHELRPEDAGVEATLERLYDRQGQKRPLVVLLEKRMARLSGLKRRDLRRRIAALWLDLDETERADAVVEDMLAADASVADVAGLLERLLEQPGLDDVHRRAIARLRAHYEQAGRLDDVIRLVRQSLAEAADPALRSACIRDLVSLRLTAAADQRGAHVTVLRQVEADAAGDRRLTKVADRALLGAAIRAMAKASAPDARAAFEDAAEAAWCAIQSFVDLLLDEAAFSAAFRFLRRTGRLPLQSGRQRELLHRAAGIGWERLKDADLTIGLLEGLFAQDAGDAAAAKSLGLFVELLRSRADHAKLAVVWEQQAGVQGRAGNSSEERACWERAAESWEVQGDLERTLAALRRASALGSWRGFEGLARIHAERGEWAEACRAAEWLCARTPPRTRADPALRLAALCEQRGDKLRAQRCLEEALAEADPPGADRLRERLIDLYRREAAWRPLAKLLAAQASRLDDGVEKRRLLREAAALYRTRLGEPAEAASLLEQAVSLEPESASLRAELIELYESLGRWEPAAALWRRNIGAFGSARHRERAISHAKLARFLSRAGRLQEALAELRLAAEMHPAHTGILYSLAKVALESGELELAERTFRALLLSSRRPGEEAALLEPATAGHETPGFRTGVFVDLAEIALRRGDPARAGDLVDSAFEEAIDQGEDATRIELALRTRRRHDLLARALQNRLERGVHLTERATALGDLAVLWAEQLDGAAELGAHIRRGAERVAEELEQEDAAASAWLALATTYTRLDLGDASRAIALLERASPKVPPGPERARVQLALARANMGRAEGEEAVATALSSALEEDPAAAEAARLLSDARERQGRVEDLVHPFQRRVARLALAEDAAQRLEAAWLLGQALERAGRASEALAVYESLLVEAQGDDRLAALSDRLEALGSERLADCLELRLAAPTPGSLDLARRILALRDAKGDRIGAHRALERAFSLDPGQAVFRDRLLQDWEEQGEGARAVETLLRAVAASPDDRALLRRLVEMGRKTGDERPALVALDAAIAAHPTDSELLSWRAQVRERMADGEGAAADMEAAAMVDARYLTVLGELVGRLAARADSSVADAYVLRLVDVLVRVNRPKQARRELERILHRNPSHVDGLTRLASVAAAEGDWPAAAETYARVLRVAEQGSGVAHLARVAVATADACERAGRIADVRASLEHTLDVLSPREDLGAEFERLCRATRAWTRLAERLTREAERETGEMRTELLVRAAHLLLDEARAPATALDVIELARSASPNSVEVLLVWARAQVAVGRANHALMVLYEAAAQNTAGRSSGLAQIYLGIGQAHLAVDEIVEAFDALESGYAIDWRVGDLAMLLGQVALDLDDEKTAERALTAVTTLPPRRSATGAGNEHADKGVAYHQLALLALRKGDAVKARRFVGKAVGSDPSHEAARALLESLDGVAIAGSAPPPSAGSIG